MKEFDNCKKVCFTGYRPIKFDFKLDNKEMEYRLLLKRIKTTLNALIADDCNVFYNGMAEGFDILCAEAVMELKKENPQIMLICCIPYKYFEKSFTPLWKEKYYNILNYSDKIIYISEKYNKWCFQERNKYMVDNSDYVVCWYNGSLGGTHNTIKYAQKKNRYIINLDTDFSINLNPTQTSIF